MAGLTASDIKFRKQDQAVTMASKSAVSVDEETINVDPILLFHRLVTIAETNPKMLRSGFEYELTNIPTTLFDSLGFPRQAKKASLFEDIWSHCKDLDMQLKQHVDLVIDGGPPPPFHCLTWQKRVTYDQLAQMNADFVIRKYGKTTVVFDG